MEDGSMSARTTLPDDGFAESDFARPPEDLLRQVQADVGLAGGALADEPDRAGAIGATMFDLPGSQDHSVTVLLPQDHAQRAPSQALVRIKSPDGRSYLGVVTAGPFAEPDTLRADSHLLVTVTARGGVYLPPYHGRIQVALLGEELADGTLAPPRLRPLPNSAVLPLSDAESEAVLRTGGDLRLGLAVGHQNVVVRVPSDRKAVLPRHLAVLGTTGGGKSTTVARLVQQAQAAGMAVIVLDVEGEYTHLHEKADDARMLTALRERGIEPAGIPRTHSTLYHLVGRDSTNPNHPTRTPFSLQFARLSPYTAMEILGLSEPQQVRFLKAYDVAKEVMRDLGLFPARGNADQERLAAELDEFERGYPRLTLSFLIDVAGACLAKVEKPSREGKRGEGEAKPFHPYNERLATPEGLRSLQTRLHAMDIPEQAVSWRALLGRLWRLHRLKVFYNEAGGVEPMKYAELIRPGHVSVVDLSDSGASELNNLVIADLLRGLQEVQDDAYQRYEQTRAKDPAAPPPTRVLIVIEEAHEFLSNERIDKMPTLFEQVARVAKRGRKRWLGLAFVTQLPQQLPRAVLGLCNNFVLHKLTDPQVVGTLKHTVSGIDDALWARVPGLAPGQAIVSFGHMTRPLLASIDPAPCKLRMMD
jgi:DNA helicase HerA-like ATPase